MIVREKKQKINWYTRNRCENYLKNNKPKQDKHENPREIWAVSIRIAAKY